MRGVGMHFNVSQLLRETSGSSRVFEVDEELASPRGDRQRIIGAVKLLRTDHGVWVSAAMDTQSAATCGRCLAPYRQPIHISVDEEFFNLDDAAALPAGQIGLDESYGIDQDHVLDLAEAVQQYWTASEPMSLVCRSECKGLCSTCGADLNRVSCRCERTLRDSRWGALLDLVPSD